jgi:hypothetical protein
MAERYKQRPQKGMFVVPGASRKPQPVVDVWVYRAASEICWSASSPTRRSTHMMFLALRAVHFRSEGWPFVCHKLRNISRVVEDKSMRMILLLRANDEGFPYPDRCWGT